MGRIETLEKDIAHYSQSYYDGQQEISDSEFDALVDELRTLNPKDPLLLVPGWGYAIDTKKKVDHIGSTVGSLSKIKYPETYDTRDTTITPKIDGGSIVLNYFDGVLEDALTRGDGAQGMSCLNKMKYILVGTKVTAMGLVSIRGEVVIPNSYHKTLVARGIPNPRNYANGIINRIEAGEDIQMLRFIPYSIRVYSQLIGKQEMLELIASWGFKRIPTRDGDKIKGNQQEFFKKLYEHWSEKFPIDGLVITKNSCLTGSKIKNEAAFAINESAIAYKFESERAKVIVGSIEWQAGNTGRITPVIKLTKPIFLSGANIVSITAHNATQVKDKGIGEGAEITIERANEVIPYLVSVDKPAKADLPDLCPDCGKLLAWRNMDLYCYNQYCPAKQFSIIKSILGFCRIPDGFGDKLLKKWINGRKVDEIIDQYNELVHRWEVTGGDYHAHSKSIITHSHYEKLEAKLMDHIYDKFKTGFTYEEFWNMIGIPTLGDSHSKKLKNTDPKSFTDPDNQIPEVGAKIKLHSDVMEEMSRTYMFWSRMAKKIPFAAPKATVSVKMIIVVTGPVSMVRKEFEQFLAGLVELRETMSKEVNYLVCNDPSSSSGKMQKAIKLGIPVITEDGLMDILGLN